MVKRICSFMILSFLLAAPFAAFAETEELRVEQVQSALPNLQAYFYMDGDFNAELEASLNRDHLETVEMRGYDPAVDRTDYYFLADCSTSTTAAQIAAVKQSLARFAGELGANDTMTLITFGVTVDVVAKKETEEDAIIAAVDQLRADQEGTLFFDALAKAIELAGGEKEALNRKLGFVFSDSVDYNLGGHTKDEIDKMLSGSGLPFYAIGFDTGSKQELDNFGAIARLSGGDISVVSASGIGDALFGMIETTKSAYVATFSAKSNIVDAAKQVFSLKDMATGKTAEMEIPTKYWLPDGEPPIALSAEQDTKESIRIAFSEPVLGAANAENFTVRNERGDLLGVRAAAYDEEGRTATLTFSEPPAGGALTVACPGITDVSMEKNKVVNELSIEFEGSEPSGATGDELPTAAWFLITILAVGLIAGITIGVIKKRGGLVVRDGKVHFGGSVTVEQQIADAEEVQVHFVSAELPVIRLYVTDPNGEGREIELPINKTIFVGRSDICDIYFDDPDMSRQHFVIEEDDGSYTITNLSETNGTMLNGIRVDNTRPLYENDRIEAGRETFVFRIGSAK